MIGDSVRSAAAAAVTAAAMGASTADARRHFVQQFTASEAMTRSVHGSHSSLWQQQQRADPAQRMAFKLVLHVEKPVKDLDALVASVSDVASAQYGKYLSTEQLQSHYAPSSVTSDAIKGFLATHKDTVDAHVRGDSVTLRMSVETAETLFATEMFEFSHRDDAKMVVIRPHVAGFTLPSAIARHVLYADGLESFPTPRQAQIMMNKRQDGDPFAIKSITSDAAATSGELLATPGLIRAQYDVPDDARRWNGTHVHNKLIVSAFLNEYYSESDLTTFLRKYETRTLPGSFQYPGHTGDCLASSAHAATGEASLDVQVAVGLTRSENIQVLCFQNNRDPSRAFADDNQEPFLLFMEVVNAMQPPPAVVSISYTDEECAVPAGYRDAVNRELMKAALRGTSIVISAGDAGVQGSHMSDFCHITPCSKFVPMFPVSSPYVTAVGATSLVKSQFTGGKYAERVASASTGDLITSGGGFSDVFKQPAYQQQAVKAYLGYAERNHLTHLFNANGRAYPDLAAIGHNFPVFQSGQMWRTDGTSVSAPIVASLLTLLNKQRLAQGEPVLGFVNPLLYQLYDVCPHVFRDVTDGDIKCGGRGGECCAQGHAAIQGWDAASGVGTLCFATLAKDLSRCIDKIRVARHSATLLGQQQQQNMDLVQQFQVDATTRQVEQAGVLLVALAAVALVAALLAMRRKAFPGRHFLYAREPAREYLLADQDE